MDCTQASDQHTVVCQALALLREAETLISHPSFFDKVFGYRGQLLAGWQLIHKAKRLLIPLLPDDLVHTQLIASIQDLRDTGQPRAIVLADRIQARIDARARPDHPRDRHTAPRPSAPNQPVRLRKGARATWRITRRTNGSHELRAWLHEALVIIFDDRDTTYGREATLHSKAMLLMVTALLLIVAVAALQNAVLLLLRSVGGFVSRLSRDLKTELVLDEYATHWTGQFLSPLAGASAGWSGVLLVSSLVEKGILRSTFFEVRWSQPFEPFTLGLAFLLGFSERFFNQVTSVLRERTDQQSGSKGST